MRPPCSNSFIHSAMILPLPNDKVLPTLIRFAGFNNTSQSLSSILVSINISTFAPVSSFKPNKRAGITRVSFNTNVSPGSK